MAAGFTRVQAPALVLGTDAIPLVCAATVAGNLLVAQFMSPAAATPITPPAATGWRRGEWATCADGRVEIRVADSGPGVPPERRQEVKERFVRLEKHRKSPGVGLGLSLVEEVAELHGGDFLLGLSTRAGLGLVRAAQAQAL